MNPELLFRIIRNTRKLRASQSWDEATVSDFQQRALRKIRRHAYSKSPFYRRFHRRIEAAPLAELPLLTKATLLRHFDEVITDPRLRRQDLQACIDSHADSPKGYRVMSTSGSTGQQGIFVFSTAEWAGVVASFARALEWGGVSPQLSDRVKVAIVGSRVPWHQSAQLGSSVRSPWVSTLQLDAMDATEITVERLNRFQPESLTGYANDVVQLAEEQLSGRLRIHPRSISTSAEVLTCAGRQSIAAAWKVEPFDIYASTETGVMAAECPHRRMHLFEDLVIVESLDENGLPAQPNACGAKTAITLLNGFTLPLIRYEMSDRIVISGEHCNCGMGFRVMGAVQGREEDCLDLEASADARATVRIHPNVFHRIFEPLELAGWQVVQEPDEEENVLELRVVSFRGNADELITSTAEALRSQGARVPTLRVAELPTLPKGLTGKTRLVVRRPCPSLGGVGASTSHASGSPS